MSRTSEKYDKVVVRYKGYLNCDYCEHKVAHDSSNYPTGWCKILHQKESGLVVEYDCCPTCTDTLMETRNALT